jgi:hypothetical protein
MMDGVGLPQGLIRFASEAGIADKRKWQFTTRMKAYSAVLTVLVGVIATLIVMRSDVEASVLRTPGILFQEHPDGRISNLYNYKVVNKTSRDMSLRFELIGAEGDIELVGKAIYLERAALAQGALFIKLDKARLKGTKTTLTIGVFSGDRLLEEISTSFVGPIRATS